MITIENVLLPSLERKTFFHPYSEDIHIDGRKYLLLPGLIDAHVHFRVPGLTVKEDWVHGARAALRGGITTVLDMPNTRPPTNTLNRLLDKKFIIDKQLHRAKLPLQYGLYYGISHHHLDELPKVRKYVVGLKVFLGSHRHPLVIHDESILHTIYTLAKTYGFVIALHAENSLMTIKNRNQYRHLSDYSNQSKIYPPEVAAQAIEFAIQMCELYEVPTYLLHLSSELDIQLLKIAKAKQLPIYGETCPQYLFFSENDYAHLKGRGKLNPPLRTPKDVACMWEAINDGTIDVLASDHAPHELSLKEKEFQDCPTGVPGVETLLPLMITAWKDNKITLQRLVEMLSTNPQRIFHLPLHDDFVLVNIEDYKKLKDKDIHSKCAWTPYAGMNLTGFPEYIYVRSQLRRCRNL